MANFPTTHIVTWYLHKDGVREQQGFSHHHSAKMAWGFVNRMWVKYTMDGNQVDRTENGLICTFRDSSSPVEYAVTEIG